MGSAAQLNFQLSFSWDSSWRYDGVMGVHLKCCRLTTQLLTYSWTFGTAVADFYLVYQLKVQLKVQLSSAEVSAELSAMRSVIKVGCSPPESPAVS